mgnify:FL=1
MWRTFDFKICDKERDTTYSCTYYNQYICSVVHVACSRENVCRLDNSIAFLFRSVEGKASLMFTEL